MHERRMEILVRALRLLSRKTGATVADVGEELGMDRRSVYRLLNTIRAIGVDLDTRTVAEDRRKRWVVATRGLRDLPRILLTDLELDLEEIKALHLLAGGAAVNLENGVNQTARQALAKISGLLSPEARNQVRGFREMFCSLPRFTKDYSGQTEIIDDLAAAIQNQQVCKVTYAAAYDGQIKTYATHPLQFLEHSGGLYVFVWTPRHEDVRVLAVERIRKLTLTEQRFGRPRNFHPQKLLQGAFGLTFNDPVEAQIWLSPKEAPYVRERTTFARQHIEDLPDGSIILHLKTSGRHDVKRWLLSLGAGARVLAPEDLRMEIVEDLRRALALHLNERLPVRN